MKVLGINTASSYTAVVLMEKGVAEGENVLVGSKFWHSKNDEASRLLPSIDELLKSASWSFSDLEEVYVVSGPGSFTGLRVGVTVANTITYLTGAKLFGIKTFEYWNLLYPGVPVVIFAGKGGIFLDSKLVNLPEVTTAFSGVKKVVGDISEDQKKILEEQGIEVIMPTENWDQNFAKVIGKFSGNPSEIVEPMYIKSPNITQPKP